MTSDGVWTGWPLIASRTSPRCKPAVLAGEPMLKSDAVTPSARADQNTPSSTSCHREYVATFAIPRVASAPTTATAKSERLQAIKRFSVTVIDTTPSRTDSKRHTLGAPTYTLVNQLKYIQFY